MGSMSGKLLVAAPELQDPNFSRAVVLVIHHEEQGAFGVVLNRPGDQRLTSVWSTIVHEPCSLDLPVLVGGPLDGPLLALHGEASRAEHEVVPGVYVSRHKDQLTALVAAEASPLRIIAGYSGWGPGQLDAELTTGSWGVTAATRSLVFADEVALWRLATRRRADERLTRWLRIDDLPAEPGLN